MVAASKEIIAAISILGAPGDSSSVSSREHAIDLLHDLLSPLNGSAYQTLRPGAWLGVEQVFSRLQMAGYQDSSHDCEYPFAPLVHGRKRIIFAFCSPYWRRIVFDSFLRSGRSVALPV